jgi:hypothetical protein
MAVKVEKALHSMVIENKVITDATLLRKEGVEEAG